jgi:hypothetical protein
MSEEFFRQHLELHDKDFRPINAYGRALNGAKVLEVGIARLSFRIDKVHMCINSRIVRGLIHPLILGWDFMAKYGAWLDPTAGRLRYLNGAKSVPLIKDSQGLSGCYYRVYKDLTIPGNSKMHTDVELMVALKALKALKLATNLVTTEPFPHQGGDVWSCMTCSPVKEGRLQYEFINTSPQSVKIEAGTVLGFAEFTEEESLEATADETEMFCTYKGYDSGYESEEESDAEEDIEEKDIDNRSGMQAKGIPRTPNGHVHRDSKMQPKTTQGILRTSKEHAHQKTNTNSKSVTFNDQITVYEFIKEQAIEERPYGAPTSGISKIK